MKPFENPSPFNRIGRPDFSGFMKSIACLLIETAMFVMFFSVFSQSIGVMGASYLSKLPLIGSVFMTIDPDASTSHVIAIISQPNIYQRCVA